VAADDEVQTGRPGSGGGPRAMRARRTRDASPGEGLRDRKKRQTRASISDTATRMFLERGFDQVRVAEVAAACGVSEKTVFNYFPTKESLLFDREEDMARNIREALGRRDTGMSPIAAATEVAGRELDAIALHLAAGGPDHGTMQRFGDLVDSTPSLQAAQLAMMERLVQVAAEAMAERAGVDPEAPEPQIAAAAIVALWRIQWQALRRYADGTRSPDEVRVAVQADVDRAARLIDTGLWSFSMAVQGTSSRQQLKEAALAANEARKQVVTALKQARDVWRQALAEAHAEHHGHDQGGAEPGPQAVRQLLKEQHKAMHRQQREMHLQQKEARARRGRRPDD
jgi:AcrR family transcriptional regulator